MTRLAVKQVPPNVARDVRAINDGSKKLDHPYYVAEERKGTGKATCRQCGEMIAEADPTLYFHYAPDDDNVWIRTRGTIHRDDCEGGKDEWTKCPKCGKQVLRSDWRNHWAQEKGKRVAQVQNPLTNPRPRSMGLDPTAGESGNETSEDDMPSSSDLTPVDAFNPRVDPAAQGKADDMMDNDLNHQVRRLQKGMRGLDQFAGSPKLAVKGDPCPVCGSDAYQPGPQGRLLHKFKTGEPVKSTAGMRGTVLKVPVDFRHARGVGYKVRWEEGPFAPVESWERAVNLVHDTERTAHIASDMPDDPFESGEDYSDYEGRTGTQACDYGHFSPDVRRLPTGGGSAVNVCKDHYAEEAEYRQMRHKDSPTADWSIEPWRELEKQEDEEPYIPTLKEFDEWHESGAKAQPCSDNLVDMNQPTPQRFKGQPHGHPGDPGCREIHGYHCHVGGGVIPYEKAVLRGTPSYGALWHCPEHAGCPDCGPVIPQTKSSFRTARTKEQRDWWTPKKAEFNVRMEQYNTDFKQYQQDLERHPQDVAAWHEEQAKKPQENYQVCRRCKGTGENTDAYYEGNTCRDCRGSGLAAKQPESPPHSPRAPYKPQMSGPNIGTATGLRTRNYPESFDNYRSHTYTCDSCHGSGKNYHSWEREIGDCYRCHGEGTYTSRDPRNELEGALDSYKGRKYMAPLMGSTGVHEDEDHYHVRLHDTDILTYHKSKPEVSIDMGPDNYWDTVTTKSRLRTFLPTGFSVGNEEVAPREKDLVVRTPTSAYRMRQGITLNMDTGKAVGDAQELQVCRECNRVREPDEMVKHQRRHDTYRENYQKNPFVTCGDCGGSGTTEPWMTPCKDCKQTGIAWENGMPNGLCSSCRGSGVLAHQARPAYAYGQNDVDPTKCGKCKGEGRYNKRPPFQEVSNMADEKQFSEVPHDGSRVETKWARVGYSYPPKAENNVLNEYKVMKKDDDEEEWYAIPDEEMFPISEPAPVKEPVKEPAKEPQKVPASKHSKHSMWKRVING